MTKYGYFAVAFWGGTDWNTVLTYKDPTSTLTDNTTGNVIRMLRTKLDVLKNLGMGVREEMDFMSFMVSPGTYNPYIRVVPMARECGSRQIPLIFNMNFDLNHDGSWKPINGGNDWVSHRPPAVFDSYFLAGWQSWIDTAVTEYTNAGGRLADLSFGCNAELEWANCPGQGGATDTAQIRGANSGYWGQAVPTVNTVPAVETMLIKGGAGQYSASGSSAIVRNIHDLLEATIPHLNFHGCDFHSPSIVCSPSASAVGGFPMHPIVHEMPWLAANGYTYPNYFTHISITFYADNMVTGPQVSAWRAYRILLPWLLQVRNTIKSCTAFGINNKKLIAEEMMGSVSAFQVAGSAGHDPYNSLQFGMEYIPMAFKLFEECGFDKACWFVIFHDSSVNDVLTSRFGLAEAATNNWYPALRGLAKAWGCTQQYKDLSVVNTNPGNIANPTYVLNGIDPYVMPSSLSQAT